jgi:hypothetical protein
LLAAAAAAATAAAAPGDLDGVSNKEIMELLLLTQYFDMVKDVGAASKGSTLFMTHSPSAVNKVRIYVAAEQELCCVGCRCAVYGVGGTSQQGQHVHYDTQPLSSQQGAQQDKNCVVLGASAVFWGLGPARAARSS